jgi:hypothetical protein
MVFGSTRTGVALMSIKLDKDRGTGRTTRQMEAMPLNGIFISCHHDACHYDKNLTRKINRADIQVVPPSWVTSDRWRGNAYSAIVLDHYYSEMHKPDPLFEHYLNQAKTRVRA